MNNLKRVLSLALASVMLVGMMAVGASAADFTDADKIEHIGAVETLVALKVINGKDDGSFDPNGDVTRGEMAKMIAVAMNGGNDANTGVKGVATFTDIAGHWAESYIEYCADLGIIAGRGDGTFAPNDKVTGLEAAKMVLTALGYDSTAYRLTGEKWSSRTDELARQAKPALYEKLGNVAMAQNASRDTAAQLIWNGLQNETRFVTPSENTSSGEVTWAYGTSGKTMLKIRYDANMYTGDYVGNFNTGAAGCQKGEIKVGAYAFPSDLDISNIGEEFKVIWKDGDRGVKDQPDSFDTIYGVFNTGAKRVVRTTANKIKDSKSTDKIVNVDGTKYNLASTVKVQRNYNGIDTAFAGAKLQGSEPSVEVPLGYNSALVNALQQTQSSGLNAAFNGNFVKLVFNVQGEVEQAYVEESFLGVITAVSAGKINLNSKFTNAYGSSLEIEKNNVDIYKGYAKDDVVVLTTLYNADPTADKAVTKVEKAEVVSGTLDSFVAGETIVVDGTTYDLFGHVAALQTAGISGSTTAFKSTQLHEDFDLYMINGFVAAAVQTSAGANNYSVIVDKTTGTLGSTLDAVKIVVMGADGVRNTLTVSKDSTIRTSAKLDPVAMQQSDVSKLKVGAIVTYVIDKNGDAEICLEAQPTAAGTGNVKYVKDTKTVKFNGKTYAVASDAALFCYVDNSNENDVTSFKTYTLRTMGDNTVPAGNNYSLVVDKDDVVKAIYMNLKGTATGSTDNTVYGIVTAKPSEVKVDGVKYNQYFVGVNDDTYEVLITDNALASVTNKALLKKGAIVKLDPTNDNIYTKNEFSVVGGSTVTDSKGNTTYVGYAKEYNEADNTLSFFVNTPKWNSTDKVYEANEPGTYAVSKDVTIFYVDQNGDVGSVGAINGFDTIKPVKNIIVVTDKDDVVTSIVYEVSGKWDITFTG